jgi:hypothetical protein
MDRSRIARAIAFFLLPIALAAAPIGNPAQPAIYHTGIVRQTPAWWSFRLSYFGDYVYNQRFHDEFTIGDCIEKATYIKLRTQAAMLTLNFRDRIDLYGILGGSSLKIDKDVKMSQQLSWGLGGKLIILHEGRFRVGVDLKYFQTDQTPEYFLCDNVPYNVVSDFHFNYHEIQAAAGVSYRTKYVSPYLHATYLIAKIEPEPLIALVYVPAYDMSVDVVSKSVIGSRRWGIALGATLIDSRKATLALEWRAFNQNSIDFTGEIRF